MYTSSVWVEKTRPILSKLPCLSFKSRVIIPDRNDIFQVELRKLP